MIDHYKTLRENMHTNPAGAPASQKFDEILRTLFTADEAAVASVMNFVPAPLQDIAGRAGVDIDPAGELCESMGANACDKPKDVCLIYDSMAQFLIDRSLAKEISREEAMEVLKRSEEAGLVHVTNNSQDRLNLTCNCCPCCCTILTGLTKIKSPHPFAVARWYAKADEDACTACGICRDERCPVGAIEIDDAIRIDPERCIGCGLCVSECPAEAIRMEQRENPVDPPETGQEMGGRVLMEKGRLEAYLELNNR